MRCGVCGRPPQSEIDAGKEVLLPREVADEGCFQEFADEYARLKALDPPATDKEAADQAHAFAVRKHDARGLASFNARTLLWLQRNAQGLHALTGQPMVKTVRDVSGVPVVVGGVIQTVAYTAAEINAIKAEYQTKLDARLRADDKAAKSPGEKFAEELGLR
jgi:hypothetical protein